MTEYRQGRSLIGVMTVGLLLFLSTSVLAQEGPVGTALEKATQGIRDATDGPARSIPAQAPPAQAPPVPSAPTTDDDSEGHETDNPAAPDHAGGGVLQVNVAGEDVLTVGSTKSRIADDGAASGDVTVLAIGGSEIVGAHSSSRGGPEEDSNDPLEALCAESDGGVCLGLLFADSSSTEDGATSFSESRAALAFLCLGGEETEIDGSCQGVVGAGVATSDSDIARNESTGRTDASQRTDLADACVGGEDGDGVCEGVGIALLHSESESSAPTEDGSGTTERSSFLAAIEAQGEEEVVIDEPTALAIPPGCPAGGSLLCIFLNQGESFVFIGGAGSRQELIHVSLLPGVVEGQDLVEAHAGVAESLARNAGPAEVQPDTEVQPETEVRPGVERAPAAGPDEGRGELAFTGGDLLALALVAMALLVTGTGALVLGRRRTA